MPTFIANYVKRGKVVSIKIEAADVLQAKRNLRMQGIRVTDIKASPNTSAIRQNTGRELNLKFRKSSLTNSFERRPGVRDKAVFANKLAALITAGVPIVRSIDLMASQQTLPLFKRALESVSLELNQGVSLKDAMRRWPKVFDRLTLAMVEAGEAGGVLDETLRRLAKLLEANARLQNQIRGAMAYPIAVFCIAIAVFLGMTIFVIPTFAKIFEDLNAELPWFTQFMVDFSKLMRSPFAFVLAGAILLTLITAFKFYQTPFGRRQVDGLLLKVPVFGDLIQKSATAQFCRTFGSLTKAGVPILQALDVVRDITSNSVVSDTIQGSRQSLMEGIPLSIALGRGGVLPDMALSMMSIGEETGEMDVMLSKVADFYEDEVETAVKALTSLLEPMMIVLVGIIVGAILIAMYLPMFSIFDQIK